MAFTRTLLVEGLDDEHVLKHLCGNRGVPELEKIKRYDGIIPLLESFPVLLKASQEGDRVTLHNKAGRIKSHNPYQPSKMIGK